MKRVLIFSLAYYPHVGGAEVAVKELTDRITDVQFDMVTLRFNRTELKEEQVGNVHVYRIGSGGSGRLSKFIFQFSAARVAVKLHRKHQYDALWALMAHSAGVPAALFKMRFPKVPYILNLQEGDPTDKIERTMLPLWPFFVSAFTKADVVQSLSTHLALWAKRMGCTGTVVLIPNGVDIKKFTGTPVSHTGTVLITTSRLVRKNGVDAVIRALPLLPNSVRFRILGVGPDEAALRRLAKSTKVSERVEFVGYVDHESLPAYLHAADIYIRPSRSEGQGASFIEAMGAGLPVIATQVGGIADFLFDSVRNPTEGTTGWAVDVDSPIQIAAQVQAILTDPVHTADVVARAREMVITKYDWNLIAQRMRDEVFGTVWKAR